MGRLAFCREHGMDIQLGRALWQKVRSMVIPQTIQRSMSPQDLSLGLTLFVIIAFAQN